jgi:hypothetical protein
MCGGRVDDPRTIEEREADLAWFEAEAKKRERGEW